MTATRDDRDARDASNGGKAALPMWIAPCSRHDEQGRKLFLTPDEVAAERIRELEAELARRQG